MRCFLICWCCKCDAARLSPTGALFGGLPGLELENSRELLWLETRASVHTLYSYNIHTQTEGKTSNQTTKLSFIDGSFFSNFYWSFTDPKERKRTFRFMWVAYIMPWIKWEWPQAGIVYQLSDHSSRLSSSSRLLGPFVSFWQHNRKPHCA